jgi:beta-galactosidase
MYYRVDGMAKYAANTPVPVKPFIQCEYAHAMGNSLGNFTDYWEVIRGNPKHFQGGFIWDFVDQALQDINQTGDTIYTYGGDYGKKLPSSNNFNNNGIFFTTRKPNPHAWEMKKVYQDIHSQLLGSNTLSIYNEKFFTDLSNVKLHWELLQDGKPVQTGTVDDVNVKPHEKRNITLPLTIPATGEVLLNLIYRSKEDHLLVPANHIVATEQLVIRKVSFPQLVSNCHYQIQ